MQKIITITNALEVAAKLAQGSRVKGVLYKDEITGKLTFKAYNCKPHTPERDTLVKKLPWGWVRESMERIKVFSSFPKDVGTATVMGLLEEHTRDAKNALIDRELDMIEFC